MRKKKKLRETACANSAGGEETDRKSGFFEEDQVTGSDPALKRSVSGSTNSEFLSTQG